jgi:hypothetical protein
MNTIDKLMDRIPNEDVFNKPPPLVAKDIDAVIEAMRRHRALVQAGGKVKRETHVEQATLTEALSNLIKSAARPKDDDDFIRRI